MHYVTDGVVTSLPASGFRFPMTLIQVFAQALLTQSTTPFQYELMFRGRCHPGSHFMHLCCNIIDGEVASI